MRLESNFSRLKWWIFEFKKAFKKLEKFFVLNYMDGSEYIIHVLLMEYNSKINYEFLFSSSPPIKVFQSNKYRNIQDVERWKTIEFEISSELLIQLKKKKKYNHAQLYKKSCLSLIINPAKQVTRFVKNNNRSFPFHYPVNCSTLADSLKFYELTSKHL